MLLLDEEAIRIGIDSTRLALIWLDLK
jgi:hypothetical protein